ncbi:MAG: FtsH protease activity modulator HflK [Myxococcales bacterium]|nr:MAG: FtsH protease activity modulator HflK [Myxococcales bacterium]
MANDFGNGSAHPPDPNRIIQEAFDSISQRFPSGVVGPLALLVVVALWMAGGLYQVGPSEVGVVMRFGAVTHTTPPGLHWHLPWPIERVYKPAVTRVFKEEIGFRTFAIGPPARYRDVTEEARMLTADGNIVELDFIVQYRIKDPIDFLFKVLDPQETLRDSAESAMREVVGSTTIDDALTEGRLEIQTRAQAQLQEILDSYQTGLQVTTVKLQDVTPPGPVQDAFKDVINAEQDRERVINESEGFANDIIPKARGTAARLVNEAEGYAAAVVKDAEGAAKRFELVHAAYAKAPEVTRQRMYIEALEEVLPEINKIIIQGGAAGDVVPLLDLGSAMTGTGAAAAAATEQTK